MRSLPTRSIAIILVGCLMTGRNQSFPSNQIHLSRSLFLQEALANRPPLIGSADRLAPSKVLVQTIRALRKLRPTRVGFGLRIIRALGRRLSKLSRKRSDAALIIPEMCDLLFSKIDPWTNAAVVILGDAVQAGESIVIPGLMKVAENDTDEGAAILAEELLERYPDPEEIWNVVKVMFAESNIPLHTQPQIAFLMFLLLNASEERWQSFQGHFEKPPPIVAAAFVEAWGNFRLEPRAKERILKLLAEWSLLEDLKRLEFGSGGSIFLWSAEQIIFELIARGVHDQRTLPSPQRNDESA
jgi:hypothetical protein